MTSRLSKSDGAALAPGRRALAASAADIPKPEPQLSRPASLGETGAFFDGLCAFVRDNLAFGSSTLLDEAVAALSAAPSLDAAALAPIRCKALDLDAALKWGMIFVSRADRVLAEGGLDLGAFDVSAYFRMVDIVYDLALEDLDALFEGDDESDDDETGSALSGSDDASD